MKPLHLVGAGEHARVVYDVVQSTTPGRRVVWHDDAWQRVLLRDPIDSVSSLESLWGGSESVECFVAIGNPDTRLGLMSRLLVGGHSICTLVHRGATISPYASCAHGSLIMAGAVVQTGVILHPGVIVNTSATVDHDCILQEGVHVAPGAHLAGSVQVGARTWIGLGAVIREGTEVGSDVMVGAGAVVVKNLPDGVIAVGNPARIVKSRR